MDDPLIPNTTGTGQWASGDPLLNVRSEDYWTSTNLDDFESEKWVVDLRFGNLLALFRFGGFTHVWPVRGGQ